MSLYDHCMIDDAGRGKGKGQSTNANKWIAWFSRLTKILASWEKPGVGTSSL